MLIQNAIVYHLFVFVCVIFQTDIPFSYKCLNHSGLCGEGRCHDLPDQTRFRCICPAGFGGEECRQREHFILSLLCCVTGRIDYAYVYVHAYSESLSSK